MRTPGAFLILTLVAGGLTSDSALAAGPAQAETSPTNVPYVTRVIYIQGMKTIEASGLVRSKVPIDSMTTIDDRNVVICSGGSEKVDQCEKILQQKNAILRAASPHKPLNLADLKKMPIATRTFRIQGDVRGVAQMLQSMYRIQEVNALAEQNSVSVSAAQPILDASEALLRELGYLL
jgi:hypothetical protein